MKAIVGIRYAKGEKIIKLLAMDTQQPSDKLILKLNLVRNYLEGAYLVEENKISLIDISDINNILQKDSWYQFNNV